ncbi:phospholipid carrier-dependent glycosyltransferase [Gemmatimonas aurantiaca]|nr:phospholipid carrier-dependent glycosyltransferase [Gemmatimonas aurantiaca]
MKPTSESKFSVSATHVFLIVFALLALVRFVHLSSDPPAKLTTSQGVYTDPAAYTLSARNSALFDNPNPIGDTRFPMFERSAISLVAQPVFAAFGVKYATGRVVALLFSLSTILLFGLILRRHVGSTAAICMFILLLINQNQFHYGRLPFLENAMLLFGVCSFWLTLNFPTRRWRTIAVGACACAACLFGKVHGIVFLPVVALVIVRQAQLEPKENARRRARLITDWALLTTGALSVALIWYFYVAQGSLESIQAYLIEQSTGIYGAPEAFQSWLKFFWKTLSLGVITRLFSRMPVASLGAFVALGILLWRLIRGKRNGDFWLSPVVVCVAGWFVVTYIELVPWNYRPLRYQLPLIYATTALAGIWLGRVWILSSLGSPIAFTDKRRWLKLGMYYFALSSLICFPVYQFLSRSGIDADGSYKFADNIFNVALVSAGLAAVIVALIVWVIATLAKTGRDFRIPRLASQATVISLLAVSLGYNASWFEKWYAGPTYTIQSVSQELSKILGDNVVISGPYGVGLSSENRIHAIVHQFGIADPDTSFFEKFPVTHLLIDESNSTRFRKMYPAVAEWATTLHTYRISSHKVTLVKVAGHTGNPIADSYLPTLFEEIAPRINDDDSALTSVTISNFLERYRRTMAANQILALSAQRDGRLAEALEYYESALALCPSDFTTLERLGDLRMRLYEENEDWALLQRARENYRMALLYYPYSATIKTKLSKANRAG